MRCEKWGTTGTLRHGRSAVTGIIYLILSLILISEGVSAQCPPNIGFETGTFANWICYAGKIDSLGVISVLETAPIPGRHTMNQSTLPEIKDQFGGFPIICPNGSRYSIKLGNEQTGAQAEAISYTLTVPPDRDSYSILYNYAVVFQNPDHADYQQPRFTAKVFDVEANEYILCSSFDFTASSGLPGFKLSGVFATNTTSGSGTIVPTSIYYKPWSPVTITLEGYAGKKLKIEFTVNDCTRGGHFGYAYIDVNEQCGGLIGGDVVCAGLNKTTLVGPYGFQSYRWYNADMSKLLGTGNTITLNPVPAANSVIMLEITPYAGSGCPATLQTTLKYIDVPLTLKTVDTLVTCVPGTIDLTAAKVTAGSSPGLSFSYYLDSTLINYIPSPKTIDETGIYYIKASNPEGCIDLRSVGVTVDKIPDITIVDPPAVYWPGTVDLAGNSYIKGDLDSLYITYWTDPATTVPLHEPETVGKIGTYYIRATTFYGCTDVYPIKVNILITHPPNAFSPNGDGVHDTWEFPALKNVYPQSRVDIFDRYGRLLFHSIGYDKPWDGTYKGQPVPLGTYYYIIKPSDKLPIMSGSVTVLY